MSNNPSITSDNVLTHPDEPWEWGVLSCNPSITFDVVLAYPDKPWYWDSLSANKSSYYNRLQSNFTWYNLDILLTETTKFKPGYITSASVIPKDLNWRCKKYLGLPLYKPIDWYPAKLYLMVIQNEYDSQFLKITRMLPPELSQLVCSLAYRQ